MVAQNNRNKGRMLLSLPYFGGKSGRTRLGKWVASLLPQRTDGVYVELCLGMGGVWLQRERSKGEVVNDLNDRVVNFWRAIRDHRDEMAHLMKNTPYSLSEFEWSVEHLDDESLGIPKRALAFVTVVEQTLFHGDGENHTGSSQWIASYTGKEKSIRDRWQRVKALSERIHYAQLHRMDAAVLAKKSSKRKDVILYFDPPYSKRRHTPYAVSEINKSECSDVFLEHKGAIAISGCDDEWDHLGWEKHELKAASFSATSPTEQKRVEQVWCNYSQEDKETLW